MKNIVINDTNIFIDLINVGLLDLFFDLPIKVHTTGFIIHEITDEKQASIINEACTNGYITVKEFSEKELFYFIEEYSGYGKVSLPDISVLFYSEITRYPLITNDGPLRKIAKERGVEVKGLLFVFDMFVKEQLLTATEAKNKLTYLIGNGTRLPEEEVRNLFKEWDNF